MGELRCLDVESGELIWCKNYVDDFGTRMNMWGMSAAPLVDGDRLILLAGGHPDGAVIALDKTTGDELWHALDVRDPGYCAPVIIQAGGCRQLIVWLTDSLNSLDPATGKVYWREPFTAKVGMSIAGPVFDREKHLLYISSFYNGSMMMRLAKDGPTAQQIWRKDSGTEREPESLRAIMCTPMLVDDCVYGVCSYGHLRCLDFETGRQLWETLQATGYDRWWNAFLVRNEDRFFIANEQGELIIARLTPSGYEEISRAKLIEPTNKAKQRDVVWSPPAFAQRCIFARNDKRLICVDLAE